MQRQLSGADLVRSREAVPQNTLVVMYSRGQGVTQEFVQAHTWLSLALRNGFEGARESLARVEKKMTPEQILEAQKLAREWKPKTGSKSAE